MDDRLSDEETQRLAKAVVQEIVDRFQLNVGKGVLGYLKGWVMSICIMILIYCIAKGYIHT